MAEGPSDFAEGGTLHPGVLIGPEGLAKVENAFVTAESHRCAPATPPIAAINAPRISRQSRTHREKGGQTLPGYGYYFPD